MGGRLAERVFALIEAARPSATSAVSRCCSTRDRRLHHAIARHDAHSGRAARRRRERHYASRLRRRRARPPLHSGRRARGCGRRRQGERSVAVRHSVARSSERQVSRQRLGTARRAKAAPTSRRRRTRTSCAPPTSTAMTRSSGAEPNFLMRHRPPRGSAGRRPHRRPALTTARRQSPLSLRSVRLRIAGAL